MTAKEYTPEEIETRIADAMSCACTYFPARANMMGGEWEKYCEAAGVDKNLAALSMYSLEYNMEEKRAFHLGYRISVAIDYWNGGPTVKINLSWSSGGGNPMEAVAQASLHLEAAHKAAQCQMAVEDALGNNMRIVDDADRNNFQAGTKLFYARVEAAQKSVEVERLKATAQDKG